MKIYTKKGDKGETFLFGGGPFPKDDARVAAYGEVDELNSVIGCLLAELGGANDLSDELRRVQEQLFMVGAELASLSPPPEMTKGFIQNSHVQSLELQIDQWQAELTPLKKFILPGGSKAAAFAHLARTVCRRAERSLVGLIHGMTVRPELLIYLNRLSDWLFVAARILNHEDGVEDILWEGILKT